MGPLFNMMTNHYDESSGMTDACPCWTRRVFLRNQREQAHYSSSGRKRGLLKLTHVPFVFRLARHDGCISDYTENQAIKL